MLMNKILSFLLCVMCVFTVGCQRKEEVVDLKEASGESDTKISGENDLIDGSDNLNENINKNDEYIFFNSSIKKIESDKLTSLSLYKLEKAKNEIFARYGHDFSSKSLKEYFESKSWYKAVSGKKVAVSDLNNIEQENVNIIDNEIQRRRERGIVAEKLKFNRKDDEVFEPLIYEGKFTIEGKSYNIKITTENTEWNGEMGAYYNPICKLYIGDDSIECEELISMYVLNLDKNNKNFIFAILLGGGSFYPQYRFYKYSNNKLECFGTSYCYNDKFENIEETIIDEDNCFLKMYCDIFEEEFLISYFKKNENGFEEKQLGINLDIDSKKIFTIKKNIQVYNDDSTVTEILSGESVRVLDVIWNGDSILLRILRENGKIVEINYGLWNAYYI